MALGMLLESRIIYPEFHTTRLLHYTSVFISKLGKQFVTAPVYMMISHASLNNSKLSFVGIAQYLIFYSKLHVQISRKSHDSIHIPDFTKG